VRLERSECPAVLEIFGAGPEVDGARRGMVIAKLTYTFDARGRAELDEADPFEIGMVDVATPLGLLPSDDVDRRDGRFDVMLLGSATSASPTTELVVRLSIGDVTQSLRVVGDRTVGADGRLSAPRPFREMPLTWERTFGGSAIVEIDQDSPVLVQDLANPIGRGLDVAERARTLAEELGCPPGFPRFDAVRRWPNVLPPHASDVAAELPAPVGWAPRDIGQVSDPHFRGDPALVFVSAPPPGTPIVLERLTPEGRLELAFPSDRVRFDYALGEEDRTRYLRPTTLVLLPDERRFYVVHRLPFLVGDPEGLERRGVVRVVRGGAS
jgi:hypothetical protein